MKKIIVFGMVALILLLGVSNSAAWIENVQNHHGCDFTIPDNLTGTSWELLTYGSPVDSSAGINAFDTGERRIYFNSENTGATTCSGNYQIFKLKEPGEISNYFSFKVANKYPYPSPYNFDHFMIYIYNTDGTEIEHTVTLNDYLDNATYDHWEFIVSGTTLALYIDGVYKSDVIASGVDEDIYYWGIRFCGYGLTGDPNAELYLDDLSTTGNVLGTMPHKWELRRNWDNPALSGIYNHPSAGTIENVSWFTTTGTWEDYIGGGSNNPPADSFKIMYLSTGEIVYNDTVTAPSHFTFTNNLTDILFHDTIEEDAYGVYMVKVDRVGDLIDYGTFYYDHVKYLRQEGTIAIERDNYAASEVAKINVTLSGPDFATFYFKVGVYSIFGELQDQWVVGYDEQTIECDTTDYTSGVYYAILKAVRKSDGFLYDLDYDYMNINEGVYLKGVTYDGETGNTLGNVNITVTQGGIEYKTTSDGNGIYDMGIINGYITTFFNATKPNYVFNNFTFNPIVEGLYEIDAYLLPDSSHITYSARAILGLVQEYPFHQDPAEGLTVHIWNATWNDTDAVSNAGYYIFNDLEEGIYTLNVTGDGYRFPNDVEINTTGVSVTYYYFLIYPLYNLTVRAKELDTSLSIGTFQSTLNGGATHSTTNGYIVYTGVEWGLHLVEAIASDYYGTSDYVYVGSDTTKSLYLASHPLTGGGPGVYYTIHYVKFEVLEGLYFIYNNPVSNVNVSVYTENGTVTGNGTTGTDGSIVFEMIESIRYTICFDKGDWSENLTIYPKDELYTIYIFSLSFIPSAEESLYGSVDWNFTTEEIDSDSRYFNLSYNDTLNETTELNFYIFDVNQTLLYNSTVLSDSVHNFSNITTNWTGAIFYVKFNATHDTFGDLSEIKVYDFPEGDYRVSLGLEEYGAEKYYSWIAIAFLFLVGSLFSIRSTKFGAVLVPGSACVFGWMGWLTGTHLAIALPVCVVVGILFYMSESEKEVVQG